MNKEIKTKWISALRSGNYDQAQDKLRAPDGYCCLGVLCDILPEVAWGADEEYEWYYIDYQGESEVETLPTSLLAHVEITGGEQDMLTSMNDGGDSFADISDWIEENL